MTAKNADMKYKSNNKYANEGTPGINTVTRPHASFITSNAIWVELRHRWVLDALWSWFEAASVRCCTHTLSFASTFWKFRQLGFELSYGHVRAYICLLYLYTVTHIRVYCIAMINGSTSCGKQIFGFPWRHGRTCASERTQCNTLLLLSSLSGVATKKFFFFFLLLEGCRLISDFLED